MENQTIKALEKDLSTKCTMTDLMVETFYRIPENQLEAKRKYSVILRKHLLALSALCDQLEYKINLAMSILETKKSA